MYMVNVAILFCKAQEAPYLYHNDRMDLDYVKFPVMAPREVKDPQTGRIYQEGEEFIVYAWGELAVKLGKFVRKGMPLFIRGKLRQLRYTDHEGRNCSDTVILAEEAQLSSDDYIIESAPPPVITSSIEDDIIAPFLLRQREIDNAKKADR